MARIDNLENFVTDIADAIRVKTSSSAKIPCADFDTEILSIPTDSGGGGEQPPCSNQWVRPKEWLAYPKFNTEFDEIYLLLDIYNSQQNPIGFKVSGYDESENYTYSIGNNTYTIPFSQTVFHFLRWEDITNDNLIDEQTKQVWVHIKASRNSIKNINLRMVFSSQPLVKTLSIMEYYGNCGNMDTMIIGTSSSTYDPITCTNIQSIIHRGGFQNNRGDFLFAYLKSLRNLDAELGRMAECSRLCIGCTALTTVKLNNPNTTNLSFAFSECNNLNVFPIFNYQSVVNLNKTFSKSGLQEVPSLIFPNVTNADYLFELNDYLETVGTLTFPKMTYIGYHFFVNCPRLRTVSDILITNMKSGNIFDKSNICLRKVCLSGYQGASNSSDCLELPSNGNLMDAKSLNALFESIQTVSLSYNIITISGCVGKDECDTTIAEKKGYTIVR